MPSKELTYAEGSSNKFWKIKLSGSSHTVEFGKVGTNGQSRTKEFDDAAEARKSFDKLIEQKLKKGYTGSGGKATKKKAAKKKVTKKAVRKASPAKKATKKKATKKATPAKKTKAATSKTAKKKTAVKKSAAPTKVNLVFDDAKSSKFWNIELSKSSHTVNYGRQGTAGQTKTKEFDSSELAQKSFDKLVAEKRKKGYTDAGGDTTSSAAATKPKSATTAKTAKAIKGDSAKSATEAPEFDLAVTNELGLDEATLRFSSFHKLGPLQSEKDESTVEEAMESFLKKVRLTNYGWEFDFSNVEFGFPLSKPVAHFWLITMTRTKRVDGGKAGQKKYLDSIKKKHKFDGKISKAKAKELIDHESCLPVEEVVLPLASLFSPLVCAEMILSNPKKQSRYTLARETLIRGFQKFIVARLSEAEKKKIRAVVKKLFKPKASPKPYESFPLAHYMAAVVGMHKEVGALVSGWDDDRFAGKDNYQGFYEKPQILLSGLPSADEYEAHWRRLDVPLTSEDDIILFLANTGLSGLDLVGKNVCELDNKGEAAARMKILAGVRAPEAAEPILNCRLNSKASGIARDWMNFNVGNCVAGLIETASSRGKLGDAAIDYYREVKRAGHESLIAKYVKKAGKKSAGAARIQKEVLDFKEKVYKPYDAKSTPKWLKTALAKVEIKKQAKLPAWASASTVPALTIGDRKLNEEQMESVLQLLVQTQVPDKAPLLEALKENVEVASRDHFAWQMFQLWLEDGANTKTKWAMGTIGHLGDDDCVLKLTPLVRVWPGESQHQRAVFGLQCLRGVGSSTALMQLSGIAQKLKFKGLKQKAALFVDEIAKEKGMTRDELEDRVIPDCGLDEMGRKEISFGTRKFDFVLGGDLKPMVRDDKGKIRPNPPKPGAQDDEKIATESLAQWKLAKKQIKEVAVLQAARMEQAMVRGRRWPIEDFETLLVRHPLMTHLVQKLIWGSFAKNGKRQSLFRVTEERDYADASDKSTALGKAASVGLVHPLELSEKEMSAWGELFGDYEIISPFPQLGRPVYTIEAAEKKATELKRFHGMSLYAPTMVFTLEKFGWIRGEAMDGGCFDEHSKQFPAYDVTAVVGYDGVVAMGYIDPEEMLNTDTIHFCKGMRPPSGYRWSKAKKLKLGDVPKLVASEVLADLNILQSKAK